MEARIEHKIQSIDGYRVLFLDFFGSDKEMHSFDLNLMLFAQLVDLFRPKYPNRVEKVSIQGILDFFEDHPAAFLNFQKSFTDVFSDKKINDILSNAGILENNSFFSEIRKRLSFKIMPQQSAKSSMVYVLNLIFHKVDDPVWISKIPQHELLELYKRLATKDFYDLSKVTTFYSQLIRSINQIAQRCTGRAQEHDVLSMVPDFELLESPFESFEKAFEELREELFRNSNRFVRTDNLHFRQLMVMHGQCVHFVEKAFDNAHRFGISMEVNQSLLRIRQQLKRIQVLLPLLTVESESQRYENPLDLALKLIKYNCKKNNVRQLIDDSTQLLAYEITQHTAKTGEKYITNSKGEYFKMLKDAMGGGFIVAFLCVIKLLFSKIPASDFGYAFLYSMNYALGFVIIYILGYTLATKQPAMTATTLVKALEAGMKNKGKSEAKHEAFAQLFSRLFRSQFIAFVGNVILAFPMALLLIWLIDVSFNYNIAEVKAPKLLKDLSPFHSAALFHASIAGVFLFFSGLIAGYQSNKFKFTNFYYRVAEHPKLNRILGRKKSQKLAAFIEKKGPGILSNFWFGVFLGSTASIGIFLGLNLDIRHITFAAGNFALGMYGNGFEITLSYFILCIAGITLIGFANFLVSFSLALFLAMRSRSIPFSELYTIARSVWYYFLKVPVHFFFPPKEEVNK